MITRSILSVLALSSVVLLGACSPKVENAEVSPLPHDINEGPGLLSGKSGNLLDAFKSGNGSVLGGRAGAGGMAAVNVALWRAALDVVSVLPLAQVDSAGGVILTEWTEVPNNPDSRVKLNVTLLGTELVPESLSVKVFKQEKKSGEWTSLPNDEATARQLEDAILTKARVLALESKKK